MCEVACRLAVQFNAFDTESFQQSRHNDTAHGVDGVQDYCEMSVPDCLSIHGRK